MRFPENAVDGLPVAVALLTVVAVMAFDNFLKAALLLLGQPFGIAEQGAAIADNIGLVLCQNGLAPGKRIDSAGGDDGDGVFLADIMD